MPLRRGEGLLWLGVSDGGLFIAYFMEGFVVRTGIGDTLVQDPLRLGQLPVLVV
jgi:hypothetical protein